MGWGSVTYSVGRENRDSKINILSLSSNRGGDFNTNKHFNLAV